MEQAWIIWIIAGTCLMNRCRVFQIERMKVFVRSDKSAEIGNLSAGFWIVGMYEDIASGNMGEQYYYLVAYPAFKVFSYGRVRRRLEMCVTGFYLLSYAPVLVMFFFFFVKFCLDKTSVWI